MYYLIKRGPEKKYDQKPFHPVIVCDRKKVMQTQVVWSGKHDWVWTAELWAARSGWLLERWNGLAIEYGHVIRSFELPDGTWAGFHRPYHLVESQISNGKDYSIKDLFVGAIWWSDKKMPSKIAELGVVYPSDVRTTAQADSHRPTAEDMAHATAIVTLETILVCGGATVLLTVVANVIGLGIGLLITALVIRGNAQVRQFSIQNAVDDRLEKEL